MFSIFSGIDFIYSRSEVVGISSEGDTHHLQKLIHAFHQGLRAMSGTIQARIAIENHHLISQVSGHDKIVFHDESRLLGVLDETFNHFRSDNTLLGVQVSRGLVQ